MRKQGAKKQGKKTAYGRLATRAGARGGGARRSHERRPRLSIPSTCVGCGLGLNSRQAPFRTVVAILAAQAAQGAMDGRPFNAIAFENQAPLSAAALEILLASLEARGQFDRAAHARVLARLRTLPSGRVTLRGARGFLCEAARSGGGGGGGSGSAGWVPEYTQQREEEWAPHLVGGGWALRSWNALYLGQRVAASCDDALTITVSDPAPCAACIFSVGDNAGKDDVKEEKKGEDDGEEEGGSQLLAGTVLHIAGERYVVEPAPPGRVEVEHDWARSWGAALAHCCVGADAGCALELLLAIYATNTQWERKAAASALISDTAQAAEEDDIHAAGLTLLEALGSTEDGWFGGGAQLGAVLEQLDKSKVKFRLAQRRLPCGATYNVVGRADGAYFVNGTTVISDAKCSAMLADDALLQVMIYAHIYETDIAFCVARYAASDYGEAPPGSGLLLQRLYAVDVAAPHVAQYLHGELLGGMDRLVGALRGKEPKAFLASFLAPAELLRREQAFLTFVKHCPPVDLGRLGGTFKEHTERRVAALREGGAEAGAGVSVAGVDPWASQYVHAPREVFLGTMRQRHRPFFVAKQAVAAPPPPLAAEAGGAAREAEG